MDVAVAVLFLRLQFYTGAPPRPPPSISANNYNHAPAVFYIKAEPPGRAKLDYAVIL